MEKSDRKSKKTGDKKNTTSSPSDRYPDAQKATAQKALQESEDRYRTLIERSPLGILSADIEGNITIANSALLKILGSPSAEETKRINLLTFPLLKEAGISSAYKQCLETQKPLSAEFPYRSKWGKDIYCRLHLNPICDAAGQLQSILGIVENITEQKELIETLAAERKQLQALMDNIPDDIYFKDTQSRFIRINRASADTMGVPHPKEAIGKTDLDLSPDENIDSVYQDEQNIVKTGKPIIGKVTRFQRADKQYRWVSATKVPLKDQDGKVTGIVGISRDITPMVKAKEKQDQLLKELEATNRELKDFAYVVSHDLKAPLRGISSLAEWIKTDYGPKLDHAGRELIDLMINRVRRMNDLIEGILHYSRIGQGKEEKKEVDLNRLISDVTDMISPPDNVTIAVEDKFPTLFCDEIKMRQVFQNLIGNAVKYMDKQEGKIEIGCTAKRDEWQFKIADNGPGIEKKYFNKIFQIFQTLNSRDETESTGVGLSVVKKIVELYGGKIWLESIVDSGTTFYFTLSKPAVTFNRKKRK